MQNLIHTFDTLVEEYRKCISDKFSIEDFREYNEILFSAHSCAIEGNSFTVDETRTLKEKGLRTDAHPLIDFFFRTAITRMTTEITSKKNATENFRLGRIGTGTLSHDLNRWWQMSV